MNKNGTNGAMDHELWQTYQKDRPAAESPEIPDALTLAAYLDGRLSETEGAAVEAWLAESPAALDAVVEASQALSSANSPAPDTLVQRASALVGNAKPAPAPAPGWRGSLVGALAAPARLFWIASFAALVMISGGAFELGQSALVTTVALDQDLLAETDWVIEPVSFESL